jgi:hypothetical protein
MRLQWLVRIFLLRRRGLGYRAEQEQPGEKAGPFLTWVQGEWPSVKLQKRDLDGSVIRMKKGEWPIHPRLIPGHPQSGGLLEF